ncbi:YqcC family protein [Alteromonas ponticola]|uniref:YqcC family protein n=1 Tax=Alteromonas aquimaris TaxID=2998417 RepID=A0ABT3P437_9ALTE|nr:YqcC family protein [Alteromonas aquimaris]MCW8107534.1 YqcC family protein [Alteromonas aquimaris]
MPNDILPLLKELEREMKSRALWSTVEPEASALTSTQPFASDTLTFTEWLQFIFIPKFTLLLHSGQALPVDMAIAPAAQVWLKDEEIIQRILFKIDELVMANVTMAK